MWSDTPLSVQFRVSCASARTSIKDSGRSEGKSRLDALFAWKASSSGDGFRYVELVEDTEYDWGRRRGVPVGRVRKGIIGAAEQRMKDPITRLSEVEQVHVFGIGDSWQNGTECKGGGLLAWEVMKSLGHRFWRRNRWSVCLYTVKSFRGEIRIPEQPNNVCPGRSTSERNMAARLAFSPAGSCEHSQM